MKNYLILLGFLVSLGVQAQEVKREFYANGELKSEYVVSDLRVVVNHYHDNGVLAETGVLNGGVATGKWAQYDENGTLLIAGKYKSGVRSGTWKHYTAQGGLMYELDFDKSGNITQGRSFNAAGELVANK